MTDDDRVLGATPNDDDPEKAFPASVSSLFASLRQYWPVHTGEIPPGEMMKGPEFTKNPPKSFCDAFDYVATNFKRLDRVDDGQKKPENEGKRSYTGAAYAFRRIEFMGTRLGYEQLILASQWVGLSVAQFVAFCHFASTERRAENAGRDSRKVLLERIDEYQNFLDELKEIVETSDDEHVFYDLKPKEKHKFYVKEALLLRLANSVRRK